MFADVLTAFGAPGVLAARTNILCLVSAGVLLPLCLLKVNTYLNLVFLALWCLCLLSCRRWILAQGKPSPAVVVLLLLQPEFTSRTRHKRITL